MADVADQDYNQWGYGDILRRAVTMSPLVWQYVMFVTLDPASEGNLWSNTRCFAMALSQRPPDPPYGNYLNWNEPGTMLNPRLGDWLRVSDDE